MNNWSFRPATAIANIVVGFTAAAAAAAAAAA